MTLQWWVNMDKFRSLQADKFSSRQKFIFDPIHPTPPSFTKTLTRPDPTRPDLTAGPDPWTNVLWARSFGVTNGNIQTIRRISFCQKSVRLQRRPMCTFIFIVAAAPFCRCRSRLMCLRYRNCFLLVTVQGKARDVNPNWLLRSWFVGFAKILVRILK